MYQLSLPEEESRRIQEKLHDTLAAILPSDFLGSEGPLSLEILQAVMTERYLDAILQESMRLYSAVTVSLPRVVPVDTVLDGYPIPKGTVASTSAFIIHRDVEVFGKGGYPVEEFHPERWFLDEEEKTKDQEMWKRSWAFGSGSRVCLGRQ